ncbi:PAS domain S-box-containing protein [Mariniflexile fucanivorans]|uniref:histidine kinase n=2 Tax=Mariniflexile fucanivorans TaxID=264023 RepID=A0A4R1RMJ2_9FLAO|nr:PAS domain S-box-containing protein [Mariniflexile fucanivorans]
MNHAILPKFLPKNSEMAQIIFDKNWQSHPLGLTENWPTALKLNLSNILNTAFPKFLLWGQEFYCFYNDAYRPSLGNDGKHPFILGQRFEDAWPELKDTMLSEVEQVFKTGKPTWHENQLVPIFRNGRMEEVYWTFSYSVVLGDNMDINGVLITCIETTDAVNVLKQLKENEDELQFAINATDLGTWDYDPLKDKLKTNERLKSWFGLPLQEEVELTQATNAIIEADRERVNNEIIKTFVFESGGRYDVTYTIRNQKNGKERIVRALGRAWFDENKIAYRFNGTLQDITSQQKSINKLKLSEENFRRLVKEIPVGIAIINVENYIVKVVNDMALLIWQKTFEESHNKPLFEILTEIEATITPIFEDIIKTKKPSKGIQYPFKLSRNGIIETAYFNFIFKPVLENNKVVEIMLVAFEVTETVKAKFELEQSEKQFKNFVMQSPIAMGILKGENMEIEMANNTLLNQFWHKQMEDVVGKGLLEIFPNLKDSKYPEIIRNILKTGIPISEIESYATLEDENGIWDFYVDYDYIPLRELDGSISGIMLTSTDVTDRVISRKKLEEFSKDLEKQVSLRTKQLKVANLKLQKSIQALENRNVELEAFAYVSSHDLQEPLRKIQLFISRINEKETVNLSDKGKNYFNIINNSAVRMRTLIDDLLAYSRTNIIEDNFEQVNLNSIVEDVLENLSTVIQNSKAEIEFSNLPIIDAIPFQMNQVFSNILSNAIKFSKIDSIPKIKITSELATTKELKNLKLKSTIINYKITISDNGIGLVKGMEGRIFEVFQRAHSKNEYEGTGIGLAIVKKIITNHGGEIYAKNNNDQGTIITIIIPKEKQQSKANVSVKND